ncbi:MAG: hypothetical protein HY000_31140 [Planctomycetes bacterium]|nr:hypothetical protein [Planctomycetota bacterium]
MKAGSRSPPDGRYKLGGNPAGSFWYAINLCRFEPGELDEFLPPGTLRGLAPDEPLSAGKWWPAMFPHNVGGLM